ncbi:MAG: ATP-binding cassette domain-containing protein [Bacteroidales bacterium]|nr:ATP-binding cassette domain-containing protein [Bacteroidales bacterium]
MEKVLRINKLSKHFGRIRAVDKLDLDITTGQVFGILGPNGSGKTTTLGMILDVVAADSGSFRWFGQDDNVKARKKIGAILEMPCFMPYLTATQNLRITAHIKKCSTDNIGKVLKQAGLFDRRNDKFKTYSLGMKQRLSIAAALLSDPPVLIFDEPTNGLDPEGIAEVRKLIKDVAGSGKTIIMASHLLDEVQKVCTHFCVLRKGKKLHEGRVSETLGEINKVEVAADDRQKLEAVIGSFPGQVAAQQNGSTFLVTMKEDSSAADLNDFCFARGITLKKLFTQRNSLEQEFLKILREND